MIRAIPASLAAVALAGCAAPQTNNPGARETVTVTVGATSTTAPAPPGVYSGNGVFSVGDQPSGGGRRLAHRSKRGGAAFAGRAGTICGFFSTN